MAEENIEYDALGNIVGLDIPEYNVITQEDDLAVTHAKREAQMKQYKEEHK